MLKGSPPSGGALGFAMAKRVDCIGSVDWVKSGDDNILELHGKLGPEELGIRHLALTVEGYSKDGAVGPRIQTICLRPCN